MITHIWVTQGCISGRGLGLLLLFFFFLDLGLLEAQHTPSQSHIQEHGPALEGGGEHLGGGRENIRVLGVEGGSNTHRRRCNDSWQVLCRASEAVTDQLDRLADHAIPNQSGHTEGQNASYHEGEGHTHTPTHLAIAGDRDEQYWRSFAISTKTSSLRSCRVWLPVESAGNSARV